MMNNKESTPLTPDEITLTLERAKTLVKLLDTDEDIDGESMSHALYWLWEMIAEVETAVRAYHLTRRED